jgi:parallel beta-helix repeat protein
LESKTQHGKNAETLHLSDVAAGDGTTDNTTAINALFTYAATVGAVVYVDAGTYGFTGLLVVPNGMRGLIGKGGTLKVLTTLTGVAGLLLGGAPAGLTPVADCDICGLTIDCNNAGNGSTSNTVGIWGQNCARVNVIGNRVINVKYGHGILFRNYIGSTEGGSNVIVYNYVQGTLLNQSSPSADWYGIGCDLEPIYTAPYTDASTQWRNLHLGPSGYAIVASTGSAHPDGNKIIGNRVIGGYYGLNLSSLTNSVVALNNVYGNQRGIALQNNATGNLVEGNVIQENFSSGIHTGYGSENNVIRGNRVNTTLGGGEALLQAYLGTKNNIFEDNDTYCTNGTNLLPCESLCRYLSDDNLGWRQNCHHARSG